MAGQKAGLTPFGKKVRKRLIDMNMTQVELAAMLGIKKQYVYKILYGERSGRKYMDKIAEILKIDTAA